MSRLKSLCLSLAGALWVALISVVGGSTEPAHAQTATAVAAYPTTGSTWAELVIAVVAIALAAGISALAYTRPKQRA